jgi:hypothetical protein
MTIKKHINVLNYFSRDVPRAQMNSSKREKNMRI